FLAARYGGTLARLFGVIVLMSCSFTYLVAQVYGTGLIASRFLGIPFDIAVYAALAGILVCSMLGGMRAVTWTQVAQYIVLIVAYLVPVVILSTQKYGVPLPQLMYGQALSDIAAREQQMLQQGLATTADLRSYLTPFLSYDRVNFFALILCLMVGTASLPHILMRYFTTPSVRDARKSVAWSLLFIFILYVTAPSYAAFAKLEVYTNVIGQSLDHLPGWITTYSNLDLVKIHGLSLHGLAGAITAARDAILLGAKDWAAVAPALQAKGLGDALAAWDQMADPLKQWLFTTIAQTPAVTAPDLFQQAIHLAAQQAGDTSGLITNRALTLDHDAIVLATPEIAGMPYVIAGLVAAGGLAAALSTADGLLLAIANALSHDIYYKMVDPQAPTARRLIVSRAFLVVVAILAAFVASTHPGDILAMVSWAFSLAAAGLFPALVMGVWWKRANKWGAVAAMAVGFLVTLYYLFGTRYYAVGFYEVWSGLSGASPADIEKYQSLKAAYEGAAAELKPAAWAALDAHAQTIANWFGIKNISSALFGLPLGFLTLVVVSLATRRPSPAMADFIDDVRRPRGKELMEGGRLLRDPR
ncbi:MAG TPA: VC_2705 family sodium/solute symporter, partial [Aestuariivirga sp.]|nr:VC_2705 family sodium/solute symporter [Aestuariivirga sp.]